MENQTNASIEELNYLEGMGEKAMDVMKKQFVGKEYVLSAQEPFPVALMEMGARILIDVAVINTPLRGFHVVPVIEGHLFLLDVQDKNGNTVADVIFVCELGDSFIKVEDVVVGYKPGAILFFYEEQDHSQEKIDFVGDPV